MPPTTTSNTINICNKDNMNKEQPNQKINSSFVRGLKTSAIDHLSSSSSSSQDGHLPLVPSKEIQFPVSWGHIAAQEWGDPSGEPVLAIHGWLDNSGSFEPLVPYLLAGHNLHIIAIDEPGCGISSHKPPGSDYNRWAHLREIKRVIDQMNWKHVTLLGHSLGAIYSLLFASIYPNLVKRVISIDIVKPPVAMADGWAARLPKIIAKHVEYDELFKKDPTMESSAPIYTYEEALNKMMEGHGSSLSESSARILMKRGSKIVSQGQNSSTQGQSTSDKGQSSPGVTFTRDIRQKLPPLDPSPTEETMVKFISRIKSDLLIIRAKQGVYQTPESIVRQYYSIYERNCRLFRDVLTDGTHHLHMNNPDIIGPIICEFLSDSINATNDNLINFPKSTL